MCIRDRIEKELYREKQIEAGVAPEDISDELPDEILEPVSYTHLCFSSGSIGEE